MYSMTSTKSHTECTTLNKRILIDALLETSNRLEQPGVEYQWGHMGQCNAGQLIQTLTGMSSYEIVKSIDFKYDEWSEHAFDYCSNTGHKVDDLFNAMHNLGLTHEEIVKLEHLSDNEILNNLEGGFRYLSKNEKSDVIAYMRSYADLLQKS